MSGLCFQVSQCESSAALLVSNGSMSGFFCCAHHPGTGVQTEAASIVLLVELRNKSAAKWGNKDAVGSSRTAVC